MRKSTAATPRRAFASIGDAVKTIARPLALLLALIGGSARAELSCRFDAALGNALDPAGVDATASRDARGLGALHEGRSRSPSGLPYDSPFAPTLPVTGERGWSYQGSVEAGVLGGGANDDNATFREYKDLRNGFLLRAFDIEAEKTAEAKYLRLFGGSVGRDDQSYGFLYGRWGDYKLRLFLDDTPHVYATDAHPIWQGLGTGNLTLPAGMVPGRNDPATIQAASDAAGGATLGILRRKGGVGFDKELTDTWSGSLHYTLEHQQGTRPFGGTFYFAFPPTPAGVGGSMETVEPIDYLTHDLAASLRYADALRQFNLTASASLFRNRIDTLTWENPFDVGSIGPPPNNAANIQRGRFDLYPDNDAYNLRADYAQAFPDFHRSRLAASASVGRMRQDDALIAPAVNSGTAGRSIFEYPLSSWNTTDALSQKSAGASMDTATASLAYSLVPIDKLTLRAKAGYDETRNGTSYTAFNPLTAQYGYPALDGARGTIATGENGFYTPGGTNNQWHYRSIPFAYRKLDYGLSAEYPIARRTQLSGEYERQEYRREHRERDRTWEDRVRIALNTRIADTATLRLSLEHGDRRGSEYNSDPYAEFFTASLPGYPAGAREVPHTLADLRKYDLSDRRQDTVNARLNLQLREDLDGFVSLRYQDSDNPASYGRTGQERRASFNAEINYQPAPLANAYVFYSHETARMQQASIRDLSIPGAPADAGGRDYPLANGWRVEMRDRNDVAGFGARYDLAKARLEVKYTFSDSRSPISYEANSAGASAMPVDPLSGAFPDLTYRRHQAEASLTFPIGKRIAARLFYWYENTQIADWHYTGLAGNLLQGQVLYLNAGPQGYRDGVFGFFLQYRL
jgi:MtrB/PioB family decaheme-associated outer membrane protein